MTPRRLALAALAALVLVALAVVVEVVIPNRRAEQERRERTLLSPSAPLGEFTLERDGAVLRFVPRDQGGWRLDVEGLGKSLVADTRTVGEIRRSLSGFGGVRTVLADDVSKGVDLHQYGLDVPRLVLTWTDDWGRSRRLVLGAYLAEKQVGAILDDRRLVLLPREVRDAADRDLAVFRNKSLINLEWRDIKRLELERGGLTPAGVSPRLVLERADEAAGAAPDTWRMLEPVARDANPTRLGSLISKLANLSAGSFGAESPTPAELAPLGLSPPVVAVTIGRASGEPIRVAFGLDASEGLAWGRVDDGPVVGLRADLRADLLLADEYFRDNRPIRLPRWNIVNLRLAKGVDEDAFVFEMQKAENEGWYVVDPRDAKLQESEGELVLTLLENVQCGRFEDALAATPGAADTKWDFSAPGSLQLRASAMLPDGRPLRVDLDAVPFLRQRSTYYAVRTIDQDAREEVCVAGIKAFDPLIDKARAIRDRGRPTGPTGGTGATGDARQ